MAWLWRFPEGSDKHVPAAAQVCPVLLGRAEPAVLTVAALAIRPQLVARVTGALEGAPGVEALVCTHGQPRQALVHIWEREKAIG